MITNFLKLSTFPVLQFFIYILYNIFINTKNTKIRSPQLDMEMCYQRMMEPSGLLSSMPLSVFIWERYFNLSIFSIQGTIIMGKALGDIAQFPLVWRSKKAEMAVVAQYGTDLDQVLNFVNWRFIFSLILGRIDRHHPIGNINKNQSWCYKELRFLSIETIFYIL